MSADGAVRPLTCTVPAWVRLQRRCKFNCSTQGTWDCVMWGCILFSHISTISSSKLPSAASSGSSCRTGSRAESKAPCHRKGDERLARGSEKRTLHTAPGGRCELLWFLLTLLVFAHHFVFLLFSILFLFFSRTSARGEGISDFGHLQQRSESTCTFASCQAF